VVHFAIGNETMTQIEDGVRRITDSVTAAFGATARVEFPDNPEFGIMPRRSLSPTLRLISSAR
jgi:hypothetical protein